MHVSHTSVGVTQSVLSTLSVNLYFGGLLHPPVTHTFFSSSTTFLFSFVAISVLLDLLYGMNAVHDLLVLL